MSRMKGETGILGPRYPRGMEPLSLQLRRKRKEEEPLPLACPELAGKSFTILRGGDGSRVEVEYSNTGMPYMKLFDPRL